MNRSLRVSASVLLALFSLLVVLVGCAPADTFDNDVYIKNLKVWDGAAWVQLPGAGALGINWLGSFAAPPAVPVQGDAYRNTTDKKSYIYYNGLWYEMNEDGAAGVNGADGADGAQGPPGGTEATLFLDDANSDIGGYHVLEVVPQITAEVVDSGSSSGSAEVLIESYATPADIPGVTSIPAGDWYIDMYRYAELGGGTKEIVIRVYKRDSGGTETELFNTTTGSITQNTVTYQEVSTTQGAFALNATDRIVVKFYAKVGGAAAKVVYYTHNGNSHYSHIHYPSRVGAVGPQGPTGQGYTFRGAWVSGQNYAAYDTVTDAGSSYVCIQAINNSTTPPGSDPTNFTLIAAKGSNFFGTVIYYGDDSDFTLSGPTISVSVSVN